MVKTRAVLVDDDERFRDIVSSILADDDIEVVAALDDGRDAVRVVAETDPDVVLIDLVLPHEPGLAVADAIRRMRPGQPIVLFSSLIDPKVERVAVAHGLTYLEKCDGVDALERAIDQALGRPLTLVPA